MITRVLFPFLLLRKRSLILEITFLRVFGLVVFEGWFVFLRSLICLVVKIFIFTIFVIQTVLTDFYLICFFVVDLILFYKNVWFDCFFFFTVSLLFARLVV